MTVQAIKSCITLQGNGTDKGYSFSFPILDSHDVEVTAIFPNGGIQKLNNGTDFTISQTPNVAGGEIQFTGFVAFDSTMKFSIVRKNDIDQAFDFVEDERLSPDLVEQALDYRCFIDQQLDCKINSITLNLAGALAVPNPAGVGDNKILVTKNNVYNIADRYLTNPALQPDGQILETLSGKLVYVDVASATNPFPSYMGKAGFNLKVDPTEQFVEWKTPNAPDPATGTTGQVVTKQGDGSAKYQDVPKEMPDPASHDGDQIVGKLNPISGKVEPIYAPQRVPPAPTTDGQSLTSLGGSWVAGAGGASDLARIEDSAGITTGYDLINGMTSLSIPAFSAQFFSAGKKIDVDFTAKTLTPPAGFTGIKYVVAKMDGTITYEDTPSLKADRTTLTLGIANIGAGHILDVATTATNPAHIADQIKELNESLGSSIINGRGITIGDDQLGFESTVPGKIQIKSFAVNSTDPFNYNIIDWTYTNPTTYRIVDKDSAEGADTNTIDFGNIQFYNLQGVLAPLPQNKKTYLFWYLKQDSTVTFLTNGYGEFDSNDIIPTPSFILSEYYSLLPLSLRRQIASTRIGAILVDKGKNFATGSQFIPIEGTIGSLSAPSPVAGTTFTEDTADGLLGTCNVAKSGVGESFDVTFSDQAIFHDDATKTRTFVTPTDVTNVNIVGGSHTYSYLLPSGITQTAGSFTDTPRGNIELAIIEHLDGARISNINTTYTSSNVDAHRIKDVYRSYKPTVEGCTISIVQTIDNTDPQNPITKQQLAMTSGRFFNYCADGTKQFDNHFIDILEKPAGAEFWYRSLEPKDYGKNWDKGVSSVKNDEFLDAKIIALATPVDLKDGEATLYPVMMSSTGNLLLIVPRQAFPAKAIPYVDGEEVWRNFEKDIDRVTIEHYALNGFLYADRENGQIIWGWGATITAIRNKYDAQKGQTTKLPGTMRYATSLVEQKGGVLQEHDYLSYTHSWDGDMSGYPTLFNFLKEITKGYWGDALLDDSATDSTKLQLGLHDLFDNFIIQQSYANPDPYTANTVYSNEKDDHMIPNPIFSNNNSKPITISYDFDATSGLRGLRYFLNFNFSPKRIFTYDLKIDISDTGNNPPININPSDGTAEFFFVDFDNALNPNLGVSDVIINSANIPSSNVRVSKYQTTNNGARISITISSVGTYTTQDFNGGSIEIKGIKVAKDSFATVNSDKIFVNKLSVEFHVVNQASISTTLENLNKIRRKYTVTMNVEDLALARDHLRLKYGKLSEINTPTNSAIAGDRPTDLEAGNIVAWVDFVPKNTGDPYMKGSYWDCYLKHEELIKLTPTLFLVDPADITNIKAAELAEVVNWHMCRYTFKGVTSTPVNQLGWDVILKPQGTADPTFKDKMDSRIGFAMSDDAF